MGNPFKTPGVNVNDYEALDSEDATSTVEAADSATGGFTVTWGDVDRGVVTYFDQGDISGEDHGYIDPCGVIGDGGICLGRIWWWKSILGV